MWHSRTRLKKILCGVVLAPLCRRGQMHSNHQRINFVLGMSSWNDVRGSGGCNAYAARRHPRWV